MSPSDGDAPDDDDNAPATPLHYIALAELSGRATAAGKANEDLVRDELRQLQLRVRALERDVDELRQLIRNHLRR